VPRRGMQSRLTGAAILVATWAFLGCGPGDPFSGLVVVSGKSPNAACVPPGQTGENIEGFEAEPFLAVDPATSKHLVGVWQQDRWSNGGANGILAVTSADGGRTWQKSAAPFSVCNGGDNQNGGSFFRSSDPWVVIAADGAVYQSCLALTPAPAPSASGVLLSRSDDGGASWNNTVVLIRDDGPDVLNDKPTIAADPSNAQHLLAVWDRLTGLTNPDQTMTTGPTWFTQSSNGVWEPPRSIFDPGLDAQTLANQIFVEPSGALVDLFLIITSARSANPNRTIAAMTSTDQGATWSAPVSIASLESVGTVNQKNGVPVRSGEDVPAFGIDPSTGRLYAVWQDSRFSSGIRDEIALSSSNDGGHTWSAPERVSQAPVASFGPSLSAGPGGMVGVSYYDLRDDDPKNLHEFLVSAWLISSHDRGSTWSESRLSGPFDLGSALIGSDYFLGDYQGLVPVGEAFVPFFAVANSGNTTNPTEIVVRSE
jgi:hypothetical protein